MLDLIQTMDEDIFVIDESGNLTSEGYIDVSRVYIRDLLDVSNNTRLGLAGGATNIYGSLGVSGSVDLDNTLDVSGAVNFESVLIFEIINLLKFERYNSTNSNNNPNPNKNHQYLGDK